MIEGENHPRNPNVLAMSETSRLTFHGIHERRQVSNGEPKVVQVGVPFYAKCLGVHLEECAEVQQNHWNSTYRVGNHLG